jgi:5-hydroxyisourate hydrolase-like protein (transthyretin family)
VLTGVVVILALASLIGWAVFFRQAPPSPSPTASVAAGPVVEPALRIAVQPEQSESGRQVRPAPSVVVTDDQGRPVAGAVVSASVEPASFADGSVVEVTTDGEGRAVFDSLLLAQAGAYRLAFTSAGYDTAHSSEFVVRFGPPRLMAVVREPQTGAAGAPIPGEPAVRVTDEAGNPVPDVNVEVTSEEGVIAGGRTTVPTDAQGMAVFSDLVIPRAGADYRLKFNARAAGVEDALSSPFSLTNRS